MRSEMDRPVEQAPTARRHLVLTTSVISVSALWHGLSLTGQRTHSMSLACALRRAIRPAIGE